MKHVGKADDSQNTADEVVGPGSSQEIEQRLRQVVDDIIQSVKRDHDASRLSTLEGWLWPQVALVYRLVVALFLAVRHERLDVASHTAGRAWRLENGFAVRTIKTLCGPVRYGRAWLVNAQRGGGWFPLDAALGVSSDGFSLAVISLASGLATRMSYAAATMVFGAFLGWSPSTEAVEKLVFGLGVRAGAYVACAPPPEEDGEVLVIEIDGKAAAMATDEEMDKRRQPRKKHGGCKCQRHRGRNKRRGRSKKRRKKGDKSKNGKSAVLVVMYTLSRGEDGKLHGPINKRVWGTFAGRHAAFAWAQAEAARRGFPSDTDKMVQVVVDGEQALCTTLREFFPRAVFTLDLPHVQERLWKAGRQLYAEGSEELAAWVASLVTLLLAGKVDEVLDRLREARDRIAKTGPNTKTKRQVLDEQIGYIEARRDMMRYDEYRRQDLALASGVVEGAARYVVGERLDCSGMRWGVEGAELLLRLRCLELNGQWEDFIAWVERQNCTALNNQQKVLIRLANPPPLKELAKSLKNAA